MTAERAFIRSGAEVREAVAAFAQPTTSQGALQLLTSFGPFAAACAAMYLAFPISPLLTLALAVPAGALLVRVFIIQHDCGHGSFFASSRANTLVGRAVQPGDPDASSPTGGDSIACITPTGTISTAARAAAATSIQLA